VASFVNRRDIDFLLYELLDVQTLTRSDRYAGHDRETFDATLDAAYMLAEKTFLPHAAKLDAQEPRFDGERVHIIPEVKEALDAYVAGGFMSAAFDTIWGGLQLPYTVSCATQGMFTAANASTSGYPFLTAAAANLLSVHGTPEQQERYMKPMVAGRYFGTMCLSEPQAGSSLGDIKTRATPQADGSYHIQGNKMWISGAEHDLSENIVNLVLARVDGAPAGVKGISLFIVPKYLVNADGSLGRRNAVQLAGLNHKMGYRGTVNCALNFGEREPCVGYLVGELNKGLMCMFHMMNEARIGVGLGASMLGVAGYQFSLDYAKQRPQGRSLTNKNPESKPVMIVEHADVRRMLLQQKSYVEGALALCLYCARLVDEQRTTQVAARRHELHLLLEILTPIAKSWPAEYCLEANKLAIQVLGGYGYTRDYPVERFYRDNRLNPIHEGTNGIQALDLLGRKVTMDDGAAFRLLMRDMRATADTALRTDSLAEFARAFEAAILLATDITGQLTSETARLQPELALGNAHAYLELMGHVVIAWLWLKQAQVVASRITDAAESDRCYYFGKLSACQYYFRYELPKVDRLADLLVRFDDTCVSAAVVSL